MQASSATPAAPPAAVDATKPMQQARQAEQAQEKNVQANVSAHAPATLAKEGSVGTQVNTFA